MNCLQRASLWNSRKRCSMSFLWKWNFSKTVTFSRHFSMDYLNDTDIVDKHFAISCFFCRWTRSGRDRLWWSKWRRSLVNSFGHKRWRRYCHYLEAAFHWGRSLNRMYVSVNDIVLVHIVSSMLWLHLCRLWIGHETAHFTTNLHERKLTTDSNINLTAST